MSLFSRSPKPVLATGPTVAQTGIRRRPGPASASPSNAGDVIHATDNASRVPAPQAGADVQQGPLRSVPYRLAALPPSPGVTKCAPPRQLDSSRLIPLATGRIGVFFGRDVTGQRKPSRVVDSEREAQDLVAQYRREKGGAR
jgi:hypothetical protein